MTFHDFSSFKAEVQETNEGVTILAPIMAEPLINFLRFMKFFFALLTQALAFCFYSAAGCSFATTSNTVYKQLPQQITIQKEYQSTRKSIDWCKNLSHSH